MLQLRLLESFFLPFAKCHRVKKKCRRNGTGGYPDFLDLNQIAIFGDSQTALVPLDPLEYDVLNEAPYIDGLWAICYVLWHT